MRKCLKLPGQELFEYVDDERIVRDVGSFDVNEYLKKISGDVFTARDFRSWHATSNALQALAGRHFETVRETKETLKQVLQEICAQTG